MNKINRIVLLSLLLINRPTAASNELTSGWSSFRNGGASTVSGALPNAWAPDDGIAWQVETNGYGQSAPLIVGKTVVISSVIGPMKSECAITGFHLDTGTQQWQKKITSAAEGPSNYMYSRAAPTPVADQKGVYTFFESGDLVAVDLQGKKLWHRNLSKDICAFESNHGLGSSLAQSDQFIILNIEHKGPSYLFAFDKSDGSIAWQVDRPSGSSWSSPVVATQLNQVVLSSAGSCAGYDLQAGDRKWSIDGLEGNSVPSPSVVGDRIFVGARIPEFGSASEAAKSNLCIRISGQENADATIAWRAQDAVCDYASPIVDGDQVYFLNKVGVLTCLDGQTGKLNYRQRLRTECWATPIVAENGVYFFAKNGTVKIVARGTEFQVLATQQLWDPAKPPTPEAYTEHSGSRHGHGAGHPPSRKPGGNTESDNPTKPEQSKKPAGPGGMIGALMKNDKNGDGVLQKAELPPEFQPMLARIDKNGDEAIDQEELDAMAKSFAARRAGSKDSSRDPIVYGVAAVPDSIVVRTGTRLFCIRSKNKTVAVSKGEIQ